MKKPSPPCTILVAESPIAASGSQSKFREIENRCAREQHLAVINIIPKVDYDRTDGQTERATAERDSNPRFGGGGGNNGPTVRIPSTPTHFLTSQFPERVEVESR